MTHTWGEKKPTETIFEEGQILPGKSHGRRSLVGFSPWGREESGTTEQLHFHFSLSCIGEGNGNPLQCSYLENPRNGGAWWAAVYGVAQSWLRLKQLMKRQNDRILKEELPGSVGAQYATGYQWRNNSRKNEGKRLWCWEGLGAGGEGDNRGWDGWMASLTWWTWVWVNSGSWWWTGRPGMLQFMGLQRVGHDWATDLIWSECTVWWHGDYS